ncbi:antitoxin VbhA family protein [Candidatus Saccharibacteria bacterium]|nr:antitoxin VbhA family protein [Candidatus Saccharibacteria bacterium]
MEKKKRERTVNQAVANERLEGFDVSENAKKITGDYVAGKISLKEAARKIRARYGVR